MWEKDKQLLAMYRECIANFMKDVRAGEEVDYEDACAVESAKLQLYTATMIEQYQQKNPQMTNEKRQAMFTPRIPYR